VLAAQASCERAPQLERDPARVDSATTVRRVDTQVPPQYRDTVAKAVNRLSADQVVIDDIGLLPVLAEATKALFPVIDAAY
jgi:hypothetical protein